MSDKLNATFVEVQRIKAANAKIADDIRRIVLKLEGSVTESELAALTDELRAIADAADATDAIVPEESDEIPV